MEREILRILEEYRDKPADSLFVKGIFEILRSNFNCKRNLKKLIIDKCKAVDEDGLSYYGFYNFKYKSMYINTSTFAEYKLDNRNKNIRLLIMILHEFAHVVHAKRENKLDNYYKLLLDLSAEFNDNTLHGNFHDFIPDERIANIESVNLCLNILSSDYINYQEEIYHTKRLLFYYFLKGYEIEENKLICPLEKILHETKLYDKYNKILNYGSTLNISLVEKLLYGLPISITEYNMIKDTYSSLSEQIETGNKLIIKIM